MVATYNMRSTRHFRSSPSSTQSRVTRQTVTLTDAEGTVLWSYAVNKGRGTKNLQSMAEAIAEHLKDDYLPKR